MYKVYILLVLCCVTNSAYASLKDNNGWKVGVSFGTADTLTEITGQFNQAESASMTNVYGGYDFNKWFGLEFEAGITGDVAENRASLDNAHYFVMSFAPKISIELGSRFLLYAKYGLSYTSYIEEYDGAVCTFIVSSVSCEDDIQSWDGSGTLFGAGAQVSIFDGLKIRLSYSKTEDTLTSEDLIRRYSGNVEASVEQVNLGIHYQF